MNPCSLAHCQIPNSHEENDATLVKKKNTFAHRRRQTNRCGLVGVGVGRGAISKDGRE